MENSKAEAVQALAAEKEEMTLKFQEEKENVVSSIRTNVKPYNSLHSFLVLKARLPVCVSVRPSISVKRQKVIKTYLHLPHFF